MPTRTRKLQRQYKQYLKEDAQIEGCEFCAIAKGYDQFISETKSFKVIKNLFPYSAWDASDVDDHILVLPKKHTDRMNDFTANECVEFMGIVGSYESQGYNVWARAPQSSVKTVVHQHTHLIKPKGKVHRLIFYINKPRLRIMK